MVFNNSISLLAAAAAISISIQSCSSSKNTGTSFVARMEVKEPIEGVCDNNNVLVLMSFMDPKQVEGKCPMSENDLAKEIQTRSEFLKNNPDFDGEGVVSVIINCKGELVQVHMSNDSESPELDEEVMAVFREQKQWTIGTYHGSPVDHTQLLGFKVEKGVFHF